MRPLRLGLNEKNAGITSDVTENKRVAKNGAI
jgi:hypothetical protein